MKCKNLIILILVLLIVLVTLNTSFANWPLTITPVIEGEVLDTTTGQPIENTIIEVGWDTSVFAFVDRTSGSAGYILIVTGKDGKYRIPAKVMLQPLGGFFSSLRAIDITVRHPLYEIKSQGITTDNIGKYSKEGNLKQWNVKLLSLDEKYKNIDRTKIVIESKKIPLQIANLSDDLIGSTLGNNYFLLAKKIKLSKDYINYIFGKWDELISKYPDNERIYLREGIDSFRQDIQE